MRILITGAAGFVGYALASRLSHAGHKITAVDRNPFKIHDVNCVMKDVQVYMAELRSFDLLPMMKDLTDDPVERFDLIVHLAATARLGVALEKPEEIIANNIGTTLQVLSYARRSPGTKVILVSSSSVNFSSLEENPYALSNKMCEDLVATFRTCFGVESTVVRLFNVYGPGETNYGKHSTLIRKCRSAVELKSTFEVYGDGSQRRDYTHIDDTVQGLQIVAELADWAPLYEIGSGVDPVSTRDIVSVFQDALGMDVTYGPPRPGDAVNTIADVQLNPPGWKPRWTVDEYLEELVDSYRRNRLINSVAS